MRIVLTAIIFANLLHACTWGTGDDLPPTHDSVVVATAGSSVPVTITNNDSFKIDEQPLLPKANNGNGSPLVIDSKDVSALQLVSYAKTLVGTPYRYASTNPREGFDCSGFITYVFNHFGINVPRSSVDFTHVGTEVSLQQAKQGNLILFTGTDSTDRTVGHMGIVIENTDSLRFIHSSSGKANGVTITPLNKYYSGRFVKVISVL